MTNKWTFYARSEKKPMNCVTSARIYRIEFQMSHQEQTIMSQSIATLSLHPSAFSVFGSRFYIFFRETTCVFWFFSDTKRVKIFFVSFFVFVSGSKNSKCTLSHGHHVLFILLLHDQFHFPGWGTQQLGLSNPIAKRARCVFIWTMSPSFLKKYTPKAFIRTPKLLSQL